MKVAVTRLPHGADLPLPAYATAGAAGLDLLAAVGNRDNPAALGPGAGADRHQHRLARWAMRARCGRVRALP